ncbi:MAG: hypothetical protein RR035_08930, partial [Oscillibacter sp.]
RQCGCRQAQGQDKCKEQRCHSLFADFHTVSSRFSLFFPWAAPLSAAIRWQVLSKGVSLERDSNIFQFSSPRIRPYCSFVNRSREFRPASSENPAA